MEIDIIINCECGEELAGSIEYTKTGVQITTPICDTCRTTHHGEGIAEADEV